MKVMELINHIGELIGELSQTKMDSDTDLLRRHVEWMEKSYLMIKGEI